MTEMTVVTVEDLRKKLSRPASRAIIGGFRPPTDPLASWFGKVNVALPGEDWPTSAARPMMPLVQFNLAEMPYRPESLADLAMITLFIDQEELPFHTPNGDEWLLRTYPTLDGLVVVEPPTDRGFIKPFPVRWELLDETFPCWEDAQDVPMPPEVAEDYYDFFHNESGTKVGGWPSLIQGGLGMATTREALEFMARLEGDTFHPEYVFQIDTEPKAHWGWGDGGVGYIGRGTGTARDVWTLEWQCY